MESSEKGHMTHQNDINRIYSIPTYLGLSQMLVRMPASINEELRVCQGFWGYMVFGVTQALITF